MVCGLFEFLVIGAEIGAGGESSSDPQPMELEAANRELVSDATGFEHGSPSHCLDRFTLCSSLSLLYY